MLKVNRLTLLTLMTIALLLAGCGTIQIRNPAPLSVQEEPRVLGNADYRFWGDDIPPQIERRLQTLSKEEIKADFPALFGQPHHYLAISGGGADGAFGAGLLVGWTRTGNRPMFQMVTGISTGALIAPFAFLGPDYDPILKAVYTTISTKDILIERPLLKILGADAVADSTPLWPRIWDIGAIASSGKAGAKDLIHRIMLASASIPGVFPPVYITVEAGGSFYDELHVDGGVCSQVFVYPAAMNWRKLLNKLEVPGPPNVYVIRNSALQPDHTTVEPKLTSIAGRSISSLIRTQGIGDLYLIYMLTRRDGANYQLAYIPDDLGEVPEEPFDTVYMNNLFEHGYRMAQGGYPWEDTPPGWQEAVGR
ncbi:MAG: patatin-like phospholipase family protein [Desulfofustis sp. PB-SRB1]|nr:patatin-like phospholipase family protein [Desulfofustis sp. PB-SRB1]